MSELLDLVKDQRVRFVHYRAGYLQYEIIGKNFKFGVPINDVGDATFKAEDGALLFMRWIRPQLELNNKAKLGTAEQG